MIRRGFEWSDVTTGALETCGIESHDCACAGVTDLPCIMDGSFARVLSYERYEPGMVVKMFKRAVSCEIVLRELAIWAYQHENILHTVCLVQAADGTGLKLPHAGVDLLVYLD